MANALRWTVLLGLLLPAAAPAQQDDATRTARVIYIGGDWLFMDAGWAEGVRRSSDVEIVRRGRTVAVLRVESVGDHRASCAVVSREVPLMLGDTVRFTPFTAANRPPTVVVTRPPAPPRDSTPTRQPPPPPPPPAAPTIAPRDTVVTLPPPSAAPQPSGRASVTFISGTEIYVGAGRQEGLVEGAEVSVVRRDSAVSTLRVKFLASHQASCEVLRGATDLRVGDLVRFVPRVPPPSTRATATVARRRGPRRLSGPGVHGRFGLRYLRATSKATDSSGAETGSTAFHQPSFDLRLNGLSIGGTAIGLSVDLRTRRTVTSSNGQTSSVDGRTRVYQAAIFWGGPGAAFRTVAGRQYLTAVTSVSMFDGGLIEINGPRVTFGAFGGVEPDAASLGFSRDIQDYGGYVQFHNRPGTAASWAVTTGAVGSMEASHANRVFGFLQASVNSSSYSFYGLQEVDYYPPWKVLLGEKQFSFTSQYATGLIRASRWLSFTGSYDNRRSVRLYRDTQNPETTFDDAYRQGFGGGVQLFGYKVRAGADWRRSTGGTAGQADSYTGTLGLDPVTPLRATFSLRATWYQNQNDSTLNNPVAQRTSGRLYSWWLGCDPVNRLHIDFNGGVRREETSTSSTMQNSTWYGMNLDASVARAWFVSLSALRQRDPANPGSSITTQLYGSATWRF